VELADRARIAVPAQRLDAQRPSRSDRIRWSERGPRVSLVIPALNEAENLPFVLARIPPGVDEIVLVDGRVLFGSPGGSRTRDLGPGDRLVDRGGPRLRG